MNKNNYQITIDRPLDSKASEVLLIPANKTEPVRLQAQPGAIYTLSDKASDKAPQQIFARRQGKNLHLQLDVQRPGEAPDLIIENFYEGIPGQIVGVSENANTYRFIPNTAQEFNQLGILADGASASQVLGGAAFVGGAAAPITVAAAPLVAVGGFALGPVGMAVAGLAGAAALAGGGGGGGGSSNPPPSPATSFKAGLLPSEDTGVSSTDNITKKTQPKVGGTAIPGSTILIKVDNGAEEPVTVDALGNWSWTPPVLSNGDHTITTTVTDPNKNTTVKSFFFTVDTISIKASLSSDFDSLNKEPTGKVDSKLNINESKNGVLMTVLLDETPGRDLTLSDLDLLGGTIQVNSFLKDSSNSKRYTLLANPTANTAGDLVLKWSAKGQALTDIAGNLLEDAATQKLTVPYDTLAPQTEVFSGNKTVALSSNQNLAIPWTSPNSSDVSRVEVTLLGQTDSKDSNLGTLELLSAGNGLDKLKVGYYTLTTTFYDAAGNSISQQAVLAVNRTTLAPDAWSTSSSTPPTGTTDDNLFINRKGNQTFTGGGGSDTFVWLARDAGKPGNADTDTITDFVLLGNGQSDKLDIKDLLVADLTFANLPKYVQLETFSSKGSGAADTTRLSISRAGAFDPGANISGVSDQVIILQGVVASSLNALLPSNLIWEATGAPILA